MAFLGKFGEELIPIPMDMEHKDKSAALVTGICKMLRPDYVIMVSEAWGLSRETSQEEVMRITKTRESIANHPDRQDIVMLTLETREGFWVAQSPIKSLGGKARGVDDFQFLMMKQAEGRFTCFLPHEGVQH